MSERTSTLLEVIGLVMLSAGAWLAAGVAGVLVVVGVLCCVVGYLGGER